VSLVLGLIPARGGSKGIPGKNSRLLAGRPLLQYAVDAATASGVIDRIVVSTDSAEIAELAQRFGAEVPFMRPGELATDEAPMLPVVQHAVGELEASGWRPDVVVVLQPTAPLRRPNHIRRALELLDETGADSVVSVVEVPRHYSPQYVMKIAEGQLVNYLREGEALARRQDAQAAYSRDGTVYIVRRDVLMNENTIYGDDCRPLVLDATESVNLDTMDDWPRAEQVLAGREQDDAKEPPPT